MKEELKQVTTEIASLNRQKALASEVTDLTLKKLGIERDTEIILSDAYELAKKDKEIAETLENLRYQKAVIDSDLASLAKRKAKLEKEMRDAAKDLLFERAAVLRDRLLEVRSKL